MSLELYYEYFLPDFSLSLDVALRLPSQCIRFEESIIFLEGVMNSDFAHTSIIYHEHIDFLSIRKLYRTVHRGILTRILLYEFT